MRRWSAAAVLAALLVCGPSAAFAETPAGYFQQPQVFYPGADLDPAIPTFRDSLGFEPGEWISSPEQARHYLEALAAASDRIQLEEYGRTYEGRPLLLATISSPRNIARLDGIRADIARLHDPRLLSDPSERDAILARSPAIVWLAYGVHGDEHSGTEAALLTAHHLTADRSEETRRWLENVVVLVDPMQNPDGRSRFLRWQELTVARDRQGKLRPDPDPEAAEHHQPWPGGRFNHYLFDLNRDWFFLTQTETRSRVEQFRRWNPQVFVDLHEMDTDETYFFPPPTAPINPYIPEPMRRWWERFGQGNADMLDRFGIAYYSGEVFDAFYPGYGDSFPSLNGAVGMTYEQASAGGLVQRRADGTLLTLRQATWHHLLTSLATIRTASTHREDCLREYAENFEDAVSGEGSSGDFWIEPGGGPGGARELAALLTDLGIEVLYPDGDVKNDSLRPLLEGQTPSATLPEDGFLVRLAQPRRRLIETLFARDVELDKSFLEAEAEKRRQREPDGFFDITAWSLPLAHGVRAFQSPQASSGPTRSNPPARRSGVRSGERTVAYLLPYEDNGAARTLVDLLGMEPAVRVQIAQRDFRTGDRDYRRGTLVLRTSHNPPDLATRLEELAGKNEVVFHGVSSFRTDDGVDLGSRHVSPIRMPRIGLLFGAPASPTSAGWLSYLLEQRMGIPYTRLRPDRLDRANLQQLDVLIFPDADALGLNYLERLGPETLDRVRAWIEDGGVFVGIGGGAGLAARPEVDWVSSRPLTSDPQDGGGSKSQPSRGRDIQEADLPDATPGAIARVLLDERSFLSLGYGDSLAVPVISRLALIPGEDAVAVASFAETDRLRLSGFMWDDIGEALSGQAWLLTEEMGNGRLVLFAGDPAFRAFWPNLNRLIVNAVVLAPSL